MLSCVLNSQDVVLCVDGQQKEEAEADAEWSQKNWEDLLLKVERCALCS